MPAAETTTGLTENHAQSGVPFGLGLGAGGKRPECTQGAGAHQRVVRTRRQRPFLTFRTGRAEPGLCRSELSPTDSPHIHFSSVAAWTVSEGLRGRASCAGSLLRKGLEAMASHLPAAALPKLTSRLAPARAASRGAASATCGRPAATEGSQRLRRQRRPFLQTLPRLHHSGRAKAPRALHGRSLLCNQLYL